MNFFVAALPRSRTAWLSVFLSQGRPCLHDGFNGCYTMSEYLEKLGNGGDSSTGLGMIDVNKLFPDSPVVIIDKSDEEFEKCVNWCDKTYNMDSRAMLEQSQQDLKGLSGLRVNQSDIDDNLEEIFKVLTGCEWKERYRDLTQFNIQSDPNDIDYGAANNFHNEVINA